MAAIHEQIKELDNRFLAAATHGDVHALRGALVGGADKHATNASGQTALHLAAQGGHEDVLRHLCENHGLDINTRDAEGCTPLLAAYQHGRAAAAESLLQMGADANARDNRGFGMVWKVVQQDGKVDEKLLRHAMQRAETLEEHSAGGFTPLAGLVHRADIQGIEVALLAGADPNARSNEKATTAYEKARMNNLAEVVHLVEPFAKLPRTLDINNLTYDKLVAENDEGKRLLDNPVLWRDMPQVLNVLAQKGEPLPSKEDLAKGGMMGYPPLAIAVLTNRFAAAEQCLASHDQRLEAADFSFHDGSALNMFGRVAREHGILQAEFSLERAEKRGADATRDMFKALPAEGQEAITNYYQLMTALERNAQSKTRGR